MYSTTKQMPNSAAGTGCPENGSPIQMIAVQKNSERMVMTVKEAETNIDILISTKGSTAMNMVGS